MLGCEHREFSAAGRGAPYGRRQPSTEYGLREILFFAAVGVVICLVAALVVLGTAGKRGPGALSLHAEACPELNGNSEGEVSCVFYFTTLLFGARPALPTYPQTSPVTALFRFVIIRCLFATRGALRHRLWSIAPRQNASAVAQHNQPARILGHPAAIDGSGNGQVVVPIDDFLLAGALAAFFEQLDGVFAFDFQRYASY